MTVSRAPDHLPDDFRDLVEDFEFIDDWEERYRYIIELGQKLNPDQPGLYEDSNIVKGCASQVWLAFDTDQTTDTHLGFIGDSDAMIVKGLIAVLTRLFNGQPRDQIVNTDARAALALLHLDDALSPQRSNGLAAMVKTIQTRAAG